MRSVAICAAVLAISRLSRRFSSLHAATPGMDRSMDSLPDSPTRWVGQRVLRREDPRLLQGRGNYLDDIRLPNMLHIRLARSPLAHATLDQCVHDRARAMPGVLGVFTVEDLQP